MNGLIVRAVFVIGVVLVLLAAVGPLGPSLGSLRHAADALTQTERGDRAMPHVVAFDKANAALTGHDGSFEGAAAALPAPQGGSPIPSGGGILDALFGDAPQPGKRRRLLELADRAAAQQPKPVKVQAYRAE